ncbi:DUF6286 domain-containing protein [Streptomyces sp. NPDC093982]|uniref:DUF6286 domain-containing protein n=1 Tax=Streptomyces sp. NPDC093982 TaxID=3155077 RepID=UPI00344181FB
MTLLGIGMVLQAVMPGRRRLFTMSPDVKGVRSTLDQASARQLMHQTVLSVPGVSGVRVRVGRRRARVRALVEFGDPDAAHQAVVTAANRALATYGLRRLPRLRVHLGTAAGLQPTQRRMRRRARKQGARAERKSS